MGDECSFFQIFVLEQEYIEYISVNSTTKVQLYFRWRISYYNKDGFGSLFKPHMSMNYFNTLVSGLKFPKPLKAWVYKDKVEYAVEKTAFSNLNWDPGYEAY